MPKFTKKPVTIEAHRFDGTPESAYKIIAWAHEGLHHAANSIVSYDGYWLVIRTLEGAHRANHGDFIIKGVKGEFYPCKPDIFAATYGPAE